MKIFAEDTLGLMGLTTETLTNTNCRVDVDGATVTITHRNGSSLSPAIFTRAGRDDTTTSGSVNFCPWCDAVD